MTTNWHIISHLPLMRTDYVPNYAVLFAILCKVTDKFNEEEAKELADKFSKAVSPSDFKMAVQAVDKVWAEVFK